MAGWLPNALTRIRRLAAARKVLFTLKARRELANLALGMDEADACDVLESLTPEAAVGRLESVTTGERMYLFKPCSPERSSTSSSSFGTTASWSRSTRTKGVVMKKIRSRKGPAPLRGQILPDDACPACGTTMIEKRGTLRLPVNGEDIAVGSAAHLRCPRCAEVVLRLQDSKRLGEDAIALYRKKHGLLSADDIRALRERFELTQADLARLLRLGANTISRWESGRNVQTAAMDMLLRLIRDLPGSIDYLRDHAA